MIYANDNFITLAQYPSLVENLVTKINSEMFIELKLKLPAQTTLDQYLHADVDYSGM